MAEREGGLNDLSMKWVWASKRKQQEEKALRMKPGSPTPLPGEWGCSAEC